MIGLFNQFKYKIKGGLLLFKDDDFRDAMYMLKNFKDTIINFIEDCNDRQDLNYNDLVIQLKYYEKIYKMKKERKKLLKEK